MFNEVEGLLSRVSSGAADPQAVQQATSDHVASMAPADVEQHLQTAADNAKQNGQNGIATQIMAMLSQGRANPQGLKEQAISFISSNPQILAHFESEFAKGILSKI